MNYSYSKKLENVVNIVIQHGCIENTLPTSGFIHEGVTVKLTDDSQKDYVKLLVQGDEPVNVYHPEAFLCLRKMNNWES